MCQPIVLGTDYGTRKFDLGSGAEFLCKKSLFYGPVESYFTAYDSVVLTGPSSVVCLIVALEGVYPAGHEISKNGPKIILLNLETVPPAPMSAGLFRSERCVVRKPRQAR